MMTQPRRTMLAFLLALELGLAQSPVLQTQL